MRLRHRRAAGHEGQVAASLPRATGRAATLALFAAVLGALGCPRAPLAVVYDLAARLPIADRWSSRQVLLFGTPSAEPHQAEGFYREAAPSGGDPFLWARGEAEVSLVFDEVVARTAVVDLAPYERVRGQSAEVLLNGRPVGRFALNDARHRYAVSLPADAQRAGENRLRFVFAATASPPRTPATRTSGSSRPRSIRWSWARPRTPALFDLLRRDAPAAFAAIDEGRRAVGGAGGAERRPPRHPPAAARGAALHAVAPSRRRRVRRLRALQGHAAEGGRPRGGAVVAGRSAPARSRRR